MKCSAQLLHIAAQLDQLYRELEAIGRPVSEGGSAELSFAGSHRLGIIQALLRIASSNLIKLSGNL